MPSPCLCGYSSFPLGVMVTVPFQTLRLPPSLFPSYLLLPRRDPTFYALKGITLLKKKKGRLHFQFLPAWQLVCVAAVAKRAETRKEVIKVGENADNNNGIGLSSALVVVMSPFKPLDKSKVFYSSSDRPRCCLVQQRLHLKAFSPPHPSLGELNERPLGAFWKHALR